MAGTQATRGRKPYDFLETSPHAIALDGISNLLRHGEADAYRTTVVSLARLQYERRSRHLAPGRGGQEIGSLPQPLHGNDRRAAGVRH